MLARTGLAVSLRLKESRAKQPRSNSASVPLMTVRHFIKAHSRGVLLAESRDFFIRPRCPQAGSPGAEPTVSKRRSLLGALASGLLVYAPLDHLNAPGGPVLDYFILNAEQSFRVVMPEPLALKLVAFVGRASRGVGVGAFDRLGEANTNPDVEACHETENSSFLAALRDD